MKKEKLLIFLLILLSITFIFGIIFLFDQQRKKLPNVNSEIQVLAEQSYVPQMERNYYDMKICSGSICFDIPVEDVREFFEGGVLKKEKVMVYFLEKVFPFFENSLGKKVEVKNKNGSFLTWNLDKRADFSKVYTKLLYELEKETAPETIIVKVLDLPGTDGRYSRKYIEIDNSKQKLYYWENGKVEKIIKLSGPKYGFQVYGVFPIIDKGLDPIAPSGNYMPYWMAFYYSPKQDSWYGLHALIWHYDNNGKKIYESLDNIGKRKSAGCIRMLVEDAKYLYSKMDRGDKVLIHE